MLKKANQIQPIREALRGHFDTENLGEYLDETLKGAAGGAAAGAIGGLGAGGVGALPGAAAGAIGFGAFNLANKGLEDIWYLTRSTEKKISWLAGDLQDKMKEITSNLSDVLQPQLIQYMKLYGDAYKQYIDYYIRDSKTGILEDNAIVQRNNIKSNNKSKFTKIAQTIPSPINTKEDYAAGIGGAGVAGLASHLLEKKLMPSVSLPSAAKNLVKPGLAKGLARGVGGLIGYLATDALVGMGYNKIAELVDGGKMQHILAKIDSSVAILEEVDKLINDLPNNDTVKGQTRMAGNYLYTILMTVQNILTQAIQNYRQVE
jgi:hypothetical protein